jgi:hypothetical protein
MKILDSEIKLLPTAGPMYLTRLDEGIANIVV